MKTSNKLLLAFFVAALLLISWVSGTAKYYEKTRPREEGTKIISAISGMNYLIKQPKYYNGGK